MEISVVIPAYNESKRIIPSLRTIYDFLQKEYPAHEIIVVDDGSSDSTVQRVEALEIPSIRVLRNESNLGKGASVKKGMLEANGRMILFSDSDLSTPIHELGKFVQAMEEGWDVVIASRNAEGANKEVKQPLYRQLLGKGFPLLVRSLGLGNFSDTQCGFKLFRNAIAQKTLPLQRSTGFAFDVELLFLAKLKGASIKELPVKWVDKEDSKVAPWKDGLRMFNEVLRIRLNHMLGKY